MTTTDDRPTGEVIYKIVDATEWRDAIRAGQYEGSADDRRDGYIHLSTGAQLAGTARKHFTGRSNLMLIAFLGSSLGPKLKWEPSRGGELFPHLYGPLPTSRALWSFVLPLDDDGVPRLPQGLNAAPR
ncbi:MAG: DUF952 domain-containing protein [Hyphomicrobiaceae bacterium]